MTAVTNSLLDNFKDAFSPVTDAFKNFTVPESAREFVKKTATTAKERAADFHAGSERLTSIVENAATGSVNEAVKISRNIQQAAYEDAEAFFAGHGWRRDLDAIRPEGHLLGGRRRLPGLRLAVQQVRRTGGRPRRGGIEPPHGHQAHACVLAHIASTFQSLDRG